MPYKEPNPQTPLLACVPYWPAASVAVSSNSTAWTDIDATNVKISFTVPASGKVMIRLVGVSDMSGSGRYLWGLRDGGALVSGSDGHIIDGISSPRRYCQDIYLTGLTPGAVKTYTWAHRQFVGAPVGRLIYGGPSAGDTYGPAVMEAWAC